MVFNLFSEYANRTTINTLWFQHILVHNNNNVLKQLTKINISHLLYEWGIHKQVSVTLNVNLTLTQDPPPPLIRNTAQTTINTLLIQRGKPTFCLPGPL